MRIVDRIKEIISVGEIKVFPSQIEAILCRHPAVSEAMVMGVPAPAPGLGECPKAFVTLVGDAATTGRELKVWLNQQLGRHEQVSGVEVRESLPRTMVGKLSRRALAEEERLRGISRLGAA